MSESTAGRDAVNAEAWYPSGKPSPSGPLLVATDGSAAGETAFRAASTIAAKVMADVEVMVVVEPLPLLVPDPSTVTEPLVASPALLDAVRDKVLVALREIAPEQLKWRVEVDYGQPSGEIASKARARGVQLIVIGLVHHGIVDRILDGDTALEVVRHSPAPVMLAAPNWKSLPVRALFAVDFSAQSMDAARAGLRFLADDCAIVLAHVGPLATVFDGVGMLEEEYEAAAMTELGKFAVALGAPGSMRVEKVTLRGRAPGALLRLADKIDADLIVAGTRGAGLIKRLLVGSVATRLMRHSTRSLLIVPGPDD